MQSTKPTLLIQTVYFEEDERATAEALGEVLYRHLTRDPKNKLAFGPGIPVRVAVHASRVSTSEAVHVLLVPILGATSYHDEDAHGRTLDTLTSMAFRPHGLILPLLVSTGWQKSSQELPVDRVLLFDKQDAAMGFEQTLLEILAEICARMSAFEKAGAKPRLFVSHAGSDTEHIAREIRELAQRAPVSRAFDAEDLGKGLAKHEILKRVEVAGLFIAVHSDQYSSLHQCQLELLTAKRFGVATLSVEVLSEGEGRSYPYSGNSPTTVWLRAESEPGVNAPRVILKALIEWLRAHHFLREAPRLLDGLPVLKILARPPELLDLAQGPLLDQLSSVVFHPDPELSYAEREVLRAARQRIRLVTPTTRYRSIDDHAGPEAPVASAALRGQQVALSISDVVDDAKHDQGLRSPHLEDAIVQLTRALVGAGATIAYGGDFRKSGYDEVFAELISEYNASDIDQAQFLYSYLPATFDPANVPDDLPARIQALGWTKSVKDLARLQRPAQPVSKARAALFVSDMRRVMAQTCLARVMVGGQALPMANGKEVGYSGAFPGTVEEAWYTLRCDKPLETPRPLYVAGGFGGAAGLVAALPFSSDVPRLLSPNAFAGDDYSEFRKRAAEFAADDQRDEIGAAADLQTLAEGIRSRLRTLLRSDDTARRWNGLNIAENMELFETRDVARISMLVIKGLVEVLAAQASGKLVIELVPGDIVDVERADVVALSTLRDIDIDGPGAALDAALGGLVSQAKRDKSSLVQIKIPRVDARWLALADLGQYEDVKAGKVPERIEAKASELARVAIRNGFRRIAVATFGATLHDDVDVPLDKMLAGFRSLAGRSALQWFETSPTRFARLCELLSKDQGVALTVAEARPSAAPTAGKQRNDAILFVRRTAGELVSTLLLPGGAAMSKEHVATLSAQELGELNRTSGAGTPNFADVAAIGQRVTELVLGASAEDLLERDGSERLVIQHDVESASIPFEALALKGKQPALAKGIVRRPSHRQLLFTDNPQKPARSNKLKVALLVGSTKNLSSAIPEADGIRKALADQEIELFDPARQPSPAEQTLQGATRDQALQALLDPSIDVLHFVGHAAFEAADGSAGGLECTDGTLKLDALRGKRIGPRVIFFNACESVRLRRQAVPEATRALAEHVLLSGVEAFIGTFWPVRDGAAADFSVLTYRLLAKGEQLTDAVARARKVLYDQERVDWANYALYGNGSFRLKEPT